MKLDEKTIIMWTIVYDNDPTNAYIYHNFSQVLTAIEGSIRGYLIDDSKFVDYTVKQVMSNLEDLESYPFIPIIFESLLIIVNRYELDKTNKIHKILKDCYSQVDNKLRTRIEDLYTECTD